MHKLRDEIICFRLALETINKEYLNLRMFEHFPKGCCMFASLMLGLHLEESGYGKWIYIAGDSIPFGSHGWIEQDNILVDITSKQYKWGIPVFIGKSGDYDSKFRNIGVSANRIAEIKSYVPLGVRLVVM